MGGTLTYGESSGQTSLAVSITDPAQSVTVTAVPSSGYVFVKWSEDRKSVV